MLLSSSILIYVSPYVAPRDEVFYLLQRNFQVYQCLYAMGKFLYLFFSKFHEVRKWWENQVWIFGKALKGVPHLSSLSALELEFFVYSQFRLDISRVVSSFSRGFFVLRGHSTIIHGKNATISQELTKRWILLYLRWNFRLPPRDFFWPLISPRTVSKKP